MISAISVLHPPSKFSYTYSHNRTQMDFTASDGSVMHAIYLLKNSLIDSVYNYYDTHPEDSSSEKYFYNSNNQQIKTVSYSLLNGNSYPEVTSFYFYDGKGNLIKDSCSYNNQVTTYTHY